MKRLLIFVLGVAVGAFGYQRLTDKIARDGLAVTIAEAQEWLAHKITWILKQIAAGGGSNGVR